VNCHMLQPPRTALAIECPARDQQARCATDWCACDESLLCKDHKVLTHESWVLPVQNSNTASQSHSIPASPQTFRRQVLFSKNTLPQRQSKLDPASRSSQPLVSPFMCFTHTQTLGGWSISGKCWSSCKTATRSAVPANTCPGPSAQEHSAVNTHATVSVKRV